ncbi:MAG: sialate O-acetylesterase [Fibrobacterota bacterium]
MISVPVRILAYMFILMMLVIHAKAATETWILSGQSNAEYLIQAKSLENVSIPMMNAESVDVTLFSSASSGKSIKYWNEGSGGWTALQNNFLSANGYADVFIWYQGEENGYRDPMNSDTYLDSLTSFINRVRTLGQNPDMTVVICQLGNVTVDYVNYPPIRDAQQRFVALDTHALLVPNLGRELRDSLVHLSVNGDNELAAEIGRALLKTRLGKDVNWPGPVLDASVMNGADGVVAHFAEVQHLSGISAASFAVSDTDGIAQCVTVEDSGNTVVSLRFNRSIKLPARLLYGYGNNPPGTLVDEAGNHAPAVQLAIKEGALKDELTVAPNGSCNPRQDTDSEVRRPAQVADGDFKLAARPNPFNPVVTISLANADKPYHISIFDLSGKRVQSFKAEAWEKVTWNASSFSSGIYLLRAQCGKQRRVKTLVLQK